MPIRDLLTPPQRVSRLYPVFTLVLMLVSSSLVYTWQEVQIRSDSAVVARDKEISSLQQQLELATTQSKIDQATLQVEQQKLADTTTKVSDLQKELDGKSADLSTKEQQLAQAQQQLKNQEDQLSKNASELNDLRNRPPLFSFLNKSALLDIDQKESAVKKLVTDAFPYIQSMYDRPYLLNKVTITFVNQFTIPGSSGEIIIENGPQGLSMDIHLKDFDPTDFNEVNAVTHELVHAFHGVAVLSPSALEEGMAVATTDAVMTEMAADGKITNFGTLYVNITDAQYQSYNRTLRVAADNDTFYSDPKVSAVYQLIGKAWYQLYVADHNFFKKFNEAYYAKFQKGEDVDVASIKDIIRGIVSSVNSVPIDTYLSDNRAFNPS